MNGGQTERQGSGEEEVEEEEERKERIIDRRVQTISVEQEEAILGASVLVR